MQAKWGIAWLVTAFWLLWFLCAPAPGLAADYLLSSLPILPVEAQSSLETQMLGETTPASSRSQFPASPTRSVAAIAW